MISSIFPALIFLIVVVPSLAAPDGHGPDACELEPPFLDALMNGHGPPMHLFKSRGSYEYEWQVVSHGDFDLFYHAIGPEGSGRMWRLSVGVGSSGDEYPDRMFRHETSTAGWRTLGDSWRSPLPWVEDRIGSGYPEVIVWDSFPLLPEEEMNNAAYGLVGWVYKIDRRGGMHLHPDATRNLARELAEAYRKPAESAEELRARAADMLARLAESDCELRWSSMWKVGPEEPLPPH